MTDYKQIREFTIQRKIGKGSFANVYMGVRNSTDKPYALKLIKVNRYKQKEIQSALNEIRILASLDHPNIIKFKEAFYDE